ncbi:hypothetical protein ACPPVO_38315 [Dactylosporangium sp. McL0621]|uniref:hypothetical protein n=1 Tax=Dactylosporangium sp. McL0621 TaxID=3415678 RepID=UPI003CF6A3A6
MSAATSPAQLSPTWWAAPLFAWLLVRAAVLPGRGWPPKRVGLVEIANCALLLACVVESSAVNWSA